MNAQSRTLLKPLLPPAATATAPQTQAVPNPAAINVPAAVTDALRKTLQRAAAAAAAASRPPAGGEPAAEGKGEDAATAQRESTPADQAAGAAKAGADAGYKESLAQPQGAAAAAAAPAAADDQPDGSTAAGASSAAVATAGGAASGLLPLPPMPPPQLSVDFGAEARAMQVDVVLKVNGKVRSGWRGRRGQRVAAGRGGPGCRRMRCVVAVMGAPGESLWLGRGAAAGVGTWSWP